MNKPLVLVFEDEFYPAEDIRTILTEEGFDTMVALTMENALEFIKTEGFRIDIALLDIKQEVPLIIDAGIQIAEALQKVKPTPFIFLTAYPNYFNDALTVKPSAFFDKGVTNIKGQIPLALKLALNNFYSGEDASDDSTEVEDGETTTSPPEPAASPPEQPDVGISYAAAGKICIKVRKNPDSIMYGKKNTKFDHAELIKKGWKILEREEAEEVRQKVAELEEEVSLFDFYILDIQEIAEFMHYETREDRCRIFFDEKDNSEIGVFQCNVKCNKTKIYLKGNNRHHEADNVEAVTLYKTIDKNCTDNGMFNPFLEYNRGQFIHSNSIVYFDSRNIYVPKIKSDINATELVGKRISSAGYTSLLKIFSLVRTKGG